MLPATATAAASTSGGSAASAPVRGRGTSAAIAIGARGADVTALGTAVTERLRFVAVLHAVERWRLARRRRRGTLDIGRLLTIGRPLDVGRPGGHSAAGHRRTVAAAGWQVGTVRRPATGAARQVRTIAAGTPALPGRLGRL